MDKYIQAYLQSLDLAEPQHTLAWVQSLQTAHLARYPFSSVNVILSRDLSLEPEALFDRLVSERSGGYCFEHNKVIFLALQSLGFDVRPLIGRVMLNGNPDNGRSHRLTLLQLDGKPYLIDGGFGVMTPRRVIALETGEAQDSLRYDYHVEPDGRGGFMVIARHGDTAQTLYRFDFAEYVESDCQIAHFYSYQSPDAAFVNHLVVSRIVAERRMLIRNLTYFEYDDQHVSDKTVAIEDSTMLYQLLKTQFKLTVTEQEAAHLFAHQTAKLRQMQTNG
ncbi:arylamine N-acetyltransferase [Photobacterium sp. 1_MG-2023]|uniref:arylamine N-acetyltransferase family protein n=1 Tax=Photobacterium sp. 1_MG-2023 TaxID=3062646 RepID=UPI0026E258DE|nr:arylamine N-acetyltransferase [Photobacterium sp. 1_MG-2023]MDO6706879.1 arylamine N-acetyltransferase [Photobacterium sp. 1_MG-2023]